MSYLGGPKSNDMFPVRRKAEGYLRQTEKEMI